MSDAPQNPAECARVLWWLNGEMGNAQRDLDALDAMTPELERAYAHEEARSYLSSEGTAEVRKRLAVLAAEDAKFKLEVHRKTVDAKKGALKLLAAQSENVRAVNSNLKEEMRQFGSTRGMAA